MGELGLLNLQLKQVSKGGGFLGPMISDVRDYYVDNCRISTL